MSSSVVKAYGYAALFGATGAFGFYGISTPLWLLLYASCLLFFMLNFSRVITALRDNYLILLFPMICVVSILWSVTPTDSISYVTKFTITYIIAIQIGMSFSLTAALLMVRNVLLFVLALSFMNLSGIFNYPWDHRGDFTGILNAKNSLGHQMGSILIFCVHEVLARKDQNIAGRAIWMAIFCVASLILILADSAAALASAVIAVAGYTVMILVARDTRTLIFGLGVLLILVGMALQVFLISPFPIVDTFFSLLSRDSTLTGRTLLWDIGLEAIQERPILGFGADAFWNWDEHANLVESLQVREDGNLHSFHNLFIEILVMVGPLGLIAFCVGYIAATGRAISAYWRAYMSTGLLACSLLIYVVLLSMVDVLLYKEHQIFSMIPVLIFVSAFRSKFPKATTTGLRYSTARTTVE
jgi:O-antigen ligase